MNSYRVAVAFALVALAVPNRTYAQEAVVRKATAVLRPNPSTIDPPEATLHSGTS